MRVLTWKDIASYIATLSDAEKEETAYVRVTVLELWPAVAIRVAEGKPFLDVMLPEGYEPRIAEVRAVVLDSTDPG